MRTLSVLFVMALCYMCMLVSSSPVMASQLVWTPINPSFGGNPYNASWLMSSAQAQNKLKEPVGISQYPTRDPLEDFQQNLSRQILSRLSSQLIQKAFKEREMEPGHYEVGGFIIDISETMTGIGVLILDPSTGAQTAVEIPFYE